MTNTTKIIAWFTKKNGWRPFVGWIALLVLAVCVVALEADPIAKWMDDDLNGGRVSTTIAMLFTLAGIGLVLSFLWIFKGIDADAKNLNSMIIYCYAFIAFSFSASVVPFLVFPHVPNLARIFETSAIGIVKGCSVSPKAAKEGYVPSELRCESQTDQWVVNIGGFILPLKEGDKSSPDTIRQIQGGLVIPLYVVVLSLMGATVSMTRRVPEYQRRLSPGDPDYVTYGHAREALVFQIMQVASAPLIAMTIYYLVDPMARVSTIVVAFAAGFSSETILLLIRALLEKLQPETLKPQNRTHVRLSPARLDFGDVELGNKATKTIAITNSTSLDLEVVSISCTGEYSVEKTYPRQVKAGTSTSVDVTFDPRSAGAKTGVLTVIDNAPGSPRAIDITGHAVEPPPKDQPPKAPVKHEAAVA